VTVHIPVPSSQTVTNLLGLAGLVLVILAVGGLAGAWWAVLAAGLFAVGLAALAQHRDAQPAAVVDAPTRELKRVS
jgi:hypothetical protein